MLSDRARITTSSAFRRLQTKAQVFSLERNATVRSRLTHTLEVATYGVLIAQHVARALLRKTLISDADVLPLILRVENACLLHDVGNPPFGHLGEFAVRQWFAANSKLKEHWMQKGAPQADCDSFTVAYEYFDGNAQGLRIISRLQWLYDEFGLNLTTDLLAAIIKYPTDKRSSEPFHHKIGFFPSERPVVERVWKDAGVQAGTRHPLAFIVEAPDDIAYCVSDIEDALEKRIVTEEQFFKYISSHGLRRFHSRRRTLSRAVETSRLVHFIMFRVELTRFLVDAAANAYVEHYAAIARGQFKQALLNVENEAKQAVEILCEFAAQRIFVAEEAVNIELAGHSIVYNLLERLRPLLKLDRTTFAELLSTGDDRALARRREFALEARLASLLSGRYANLYRWSTARAPSLELIYRTQLLVDYVAGMTDTHALQVHDMLMGNVKGLQQ